MEVNPAFEILIGIIAPLGTDRKWFVNALEDRFVARDYSIEKISVTQEVINFIPNDW